MKYIQSSVQVRNGSSSVDVSNLLKPELARGNIRCIGSTTYQEYRNIFTKNQRNLSRRFQKIDVNEPTVDECITILNGVICEYENYHNVSFQRNPLSRQFIYQINT